MDTSKEKHFDLCLSGKLFLCFYRHIYLFCLYKTKKIDHTLGEHILIAGMEQPIKIKVGT
jgi:hypothetical protein